jgi:VWFA-related protein
LTAQQSRPTFRAGVVLVPVDVSVLDGHGKPVTDLKQSDFTIFEDKVPQTIKTFAATALAPEPPPPDQPATLLRTTPAHHQLQADSLTPQRRRTFLIVLGWGRLEEPTGVYEATAQFLRERLLPQDMVSLLAWDRATDFTTNHEEVAQIVERYKKQNPDIMQAIRHWVFWHPDEDLPAAIQARIDAVFGVSPPGRGPAPLVGIRSATEMLFGTEEFKRMNRDPHAVPWNLYVTWEIEGGNNYLTRRGQGGKYAPGELQLGGDLPKIYAGIEYLRYLEGEKHMIVCIPGDQGGFAGTSVEDDSRFAARAGDARIVVDVIHTAGVPAFKGFSPRPSLSVSDPGFTWGAASSETVAELTGGQFLGTYPAAATFARVDEATRFGYLLGYTPTNPALDSKFRKITVKVNRSGVAVFFRYGYHAQEDVPPLDLKAAVTSARSLDAAVLDLESHDIKVRALASASPAVFGRGQARVEITIDSSTLTLLMANGRRTGQLDVAIYCGDAKQNVVGELKESIDVDLSEEDYKQALANGLRYTMRVPISADAAFAKVIVYDFATDRAGTAMVKIPPR